MREAIKLFPECKASVHLLRELKKQFFKLPLLKMVLAAISIAKGARDGSKHGRGEKILSSGKLDTYEFRGKR